jgi:hypothetical protein
MNVTFDSVPKVFASLGIIIAGWCALEFYHSLQRAQAASAVVKASLAEAQVLSRQRQDGVDEIAVRVREMEQAFLQGATALKQGKPKEAMELLAKVQDIGKKNASEFQRDQELRTRQEAKAIELARQLAMANAELDATQRLGYFLFGGLCVGALMASSGIQAWVRRDAEARGNANKVTVRRVSRKRGDP